MAKTKPRKLTPLEGEIMDCVWDLGEATVRQVHKRLGPERAYNTVQTMLTILRRKGFLRSRREGRADVYRPAVARDQMAGGSLRLVIDRFFAGSAAALVSHLLSSGDVSDQELEAMQRAVDDRRHAEGGAQRED